MFNPYQVLLSSGYPLMFRNHILKIRRKQGQQAYYRQRCQKVQKIMTKDITLHCWTRQPPTYVFVQVGWHLSACCHMGWSALGRSSAWEKVESITNVKKIDAFFEVWGTSLVWVFQQFLNINGTKPRINYYRQSYYFAIWNINYSHLAIRRPFVAAVLCLPWYSVIWIDQDLGSSHRKFF